MTDPKAACSFPTRRGERCEKPQDDPIHVSEHERMRHGAHVFRTGPIGKRITPDERAVIEAAVSWVAATDESAFFAGAIDPIGKARASADTLRAAVDRLIESREGLTDD